MRIAKTLLFVVFACVLFPQPMVSGDERDSSMLEKMGVTRGVCVLLGDSTGRLAVELAHMSDLLIYVQSPQDQDVQTVREAADAANLYGTRIFVDKGPKTKLYLADNLADAVVALGGAKDISKSEAMRVLRPQGKALFGRDVLVKPSPPGVDDWSHPYHGPDNNPQSNDRIARGPHQTRFLAEPRYAPLPQVAVASAGRVFKAFGHVAFKTREEPLLNKLVAFNGYNGTILWQRDLAEGVMIHRNTMIATPTRLYVGDDKSCKVIDAETGRLIDEIIPPVKVAGGAFWKWMAIENDTLYALTGEQEQRDPTMRWRREKHGWPWNPISKGFNQPDGIKDSRKAYLAHPWGFGRNVLAIDLKTRRVLWNYRENEPVDGRAMCMKNGRIHIFRFGSYLTGLKAKTGDVVWVSHQNSRRVLCFNRMDRSVLKRNMANPRNQFLVDWTKLGVRDKPLWSHDCKESVAVATCGNAVVIAEASKVIALSIDDGRLLWSRSLPVSPIEWGLAIDKHGQAVIVLKDGRILCFGRSIKNLESEISD